MIFSDKMEMRKIFGPDSVLAAHLAAYESRAGQLEMAQAIFALLHEAGERYAAENRAACLLIEAETGLGKTLAYLVPAVASGCKTVVSTNTKNLQDQILNREIPFIRRYLYPELKATCVKGRENYLCLYRWYQFLASRPAELFVDTEVAQIKQWLDRTAFADRAELSFLTENSPLWRAVCCQSHSCLGNDCPESSGCFLNQLRKEAAASRLILVNHHLLFSDLAVRRGGYGEVLPRYEAVIFDEAHHLENIATTFFGFSFSKYQVKDLAADLEQSALSGLTGKKQEEVLTICRSLGGLVEQFSACFPAEKGRFPLADLFENIPELSRSRDNLAATLTRLAGQLEGFSGREEPWEHYLQRCRELASRLQTITVSLFDDLAPEEMRFVHWYERGERNLSLCASPIDVAEDIRKSLLSSVNACVFTSATLRTGGSFDYFRQRHGLAEDTPTLTFPSPFNYPQQSLLYVPGQGFPEPAAPGYSRALHHEIETLINLARGRTLVLFTSIQAMKAAHHSLRDSLAFPLLLQGTAPRHELLRRFAEETDSVLFGVASFWEGVDVAGESLSLVIIDKIPFEVPSDPVIMARINQIKATGGNPFTDFQIPRAILSLRQGVGRLMRSSTDRGVMAILDVRLFTKGYGGHFLKSLPASPLTRDREDVKTFFATL